MKIPRFFWYVLVPLVLGGLFLVAQGPQARVVPVIKPSFFQAPFELGYWSYKQIRPRLLQVNRILVFYSEDQKDLMTDFIGGFVSEAHRDSLGFQLVSAVGMQLGGTETPKSASNKIEVEALPDRAHLAELANAKTIVILLNAYGPFDEKLECDYEQLASLSWKAELKCLLKGNARKFFKGKVTGNGSVLASVDLVGAKVYSVTTYERAQAVK